MGAREAAEQEKESVEAEYRLDEVVHILSMADMRVLHQSLKKSGKGCGKSEGRVVPEGEHRGSGS